MNKTIYTSLALLSLLFSYSTTAEPLFFKATKGGKDLMILGSIHMGHQQMYPLPEVINQYLLSSDAVITEVELVDTPPNIQFNTKTAKEVLSASQKEKLEDINEELGFNRKAFLNHPAWQTAITLQVAQFEKMGFTSDLGIDQYITQKAKEQNKAILGLESIEYQLALFSEDPDVSQLLLTDAIDNWQENAGLSECLIKSWQAGDQTQLEQLATESFVEEDLGEQFLYQRNRNWADRLDSDEFISNGKFLVVVGALHIVGKDNLISLLSQKGFSVSQLSNEENAVCL